MIGRTLSLYLAERFARTVIAAFLVVFVLIYSVDLVELLRRSGDSQRATGILMAGLSFLQNADDRRAGFAVRSSVRLYDRIPEPVAEDGAGGGARGGCLRLADIDRRRSS